MNSYWAKTSTAIGLCAWLCAGSVLAGPNDVFDEPSGELQPHHILNEPTAPEAAPELPQPPAEDIAINATSGITVSDATSSYEAYGLDTISSEWLNNNIWQYLDINEARTLLDGLPKTINSLTLRHALHDILLFPAPTPRNTKDGWLIARGDALSHIGYITTSAELLSTVPDAVRSQPVAESASLHLMQAGKSQEACSNAPTASQENDLWKRFELFCHAVNERFDKADLAISLAEESGTPYPKWFVSLIDSLQYEHSRISLPNKHLKGLDLAMMLYAGESRLPKTVDVMSYLDKPAFHYLIGSSNQYPTPTRIAYLEALGQRTESDKVLEELYSNLSKRSVSKEQRAMLARATAYDQLANTTSSTQAKKRIGKALNLFKRDKLMPLAQSLLSKPIIALSHSMKRQASYVDYAPDAFAILMRANKQGVTHKWLDLMDVHRTDDITTYVAHELVQFDNHAGDSNLSPAAKELPPYLLPENASQEELHMLAHFYAILELFDFTPPSITQEAVHEKLGSDSQSTIPTSIISDYAGRGSLAGTLLSAASLLGDKPLFESPDTLTLEIIQALLTLQQPELAKRFAIESVLARF